MKGQENEILLVVRNDFVLSLIETNQFEEIFERKQLDSIHSNNDVYRC